MRNGKAKTWEQYKAECEAVAAPGVTVVGFVEPWKGNSTKLTCVCEKHGEWKSTNIDKFKTGRSCPTCAKESFSGIRAVSWQSHRAECEAIAKPGISIKGFVSPWTGNTTILICECEKHGEWRTTSIASFKRGSSCTSCKGETISIDKTMPEDLATKQILASANLPAHITIKKLKGRRWEVSCQKCANDEYAKAGVCNGAFKAGKAELMRGGLPCRCSIKPNLTPEQWRYRLTTECTKRGYEFIDFKDKAGNKKPFTYLCPLHGIQQSTPDPFLRGTSCPQCRGKNHREAYISLLGDGLGRWENIKFGIARDSLRRVRDQQSKTNAFQVRSAAIYCFETVQQCRAAERAVFTAFAGLTGSVPKHLLPDGFTETLPISFMQQVEEIYKEHGGTLKPVSLARPKRQKVRKMC